MLTIGLDRAGWPFILGAVGVAVAGAWLGGRWWAVPGALLALGFLFFFRDPERTLPADQSLVLSPADGVVKFVGPAMAGGPDGTWQQITIFLSPMDVHVNRAPVSGRVTQVRYKPGRFLPAYRPESGAVNEQSEVWVDHDGRAAVFRQVVGILARRVVTRVREGDRLRVGQRVGVMKFGSRMDVFLPVDLPVEVRAGDRVVAGVTVLSRWSR
ncbi:MAG: phosphatidylserine decarboxylase [Vicinamibacterales bacterium]